MSNNNVNFNTTGLTVGNTTISSTGDIASTANLSVGSLVVNGSPVTSGGGSGGGSAYVSSSFSASSGYSYMVDTSSSAVVATLPSAPTSGTVISFMDYNNSFGLNSFTVNPNGQTIAGRTGNLVINNSDASFSLVYDGTKWNPIRDQTRATVVYNNTVSITQQQSSVLQYVYRFARIAFGKGKFVGVGYQSTSGIAYAYVSSDGLTWTTVNLPVSLSWNFVKYLNGVFIANGNDINGNGTTILSIDGVTWNLVNTPANYAVSAGACSSNTIVLLLTAITQEVLVSTTNGSSWTTSTLPVASAWSSISYGNGVFVALPYNGTSIVAVSPDGINWTQYAMPSAHNWQNVAFGNGVFVAITHSGIYAVSPDGINWTQYPAYSNSIGYGYLVFGNGMFATIGNGVIRTSTDGINWTYLIDKNNVPTSGNFVFGNGVLITSNNYNSLDVVYQTIII